MICCRSARSLSGLPHHVDARLGTLGCGRLATEIPSPCMTRQGRLCISRQRGNLNSADMAGTSRGIWVRWQTLSQSDAPARKRGALCRTRPSVRLDKAFWPQVRPIRAQRTPPLNSRGWEPGHYFPRFTQFHAYIRPARAIQLI